MTAPSMLTRAGRLRPAIRTATRELFHATPAYGRGYRVMARAARAHPWERLDDLRFKGPVAALDIQLLAQFGMFNQGVMRPIDGGSGHVHITCEDDKWVVQRRTNGSCFGPSSESAKQEPPN